MKNNGIWLHRKLYLCSHKYTWKYEADEGEMCVLGENQKCPSQNNTLRKKVLQSTFFGASGCHK